MVVVVVVIHAIAVPSRSVVVIVERRVGRWGVRVAYDKIVTNQDRRDILRSHDYDDPWSPYHIIPTTNETTTASDATNAYPY